MNVLGIGVHWLISRLNICNCAMTKFVFFLEEKLVRSRKKEGRKEGKKERKERKEGRRKEKKRKEGRKEERKKEILVLSVLFLIPSAFL